MSKDITLDDIRGFVHHSYRLSEKSQSNSAAVEHSYAPAPFQRPVSAAEEAKQAGQLSRVIEEEDVPPEARLHQSDSHDVAAPPVQNNHASIPTLLDITAHVGQEQENGDGHEAMAVRPSQEILDETRVDANPNHLSSKPLDAEADGGE